MKDVLHEALLMAQKSADEKVKSAQEQASKIISDAKERADIICKDATQEADVCVTEFPRSEMYEICTNRSLEGCLRSLTTCSTRASTLQPLLQL